MTDAPTTDRWIRHLNLLQLVLAGIIIMTPTVWMVLSSLKPSFEVTAYPPTLIFSPTLENYVQLMKTTPFVSYAVNSLIVTIGSTSLGLLFGIPAAFAVSWTRISWPAILTLAARMAPGTLFLLPWYVMFRQVGMIGSYTALILSHAVITLPIVIWVLLPSFDGIPRSVFEAAQVDGCSVTRILWRIALPLVGSGVAVAAILAFVFSWNYFLFALVLSNGDSKTLIAAAFNFVGEGSTQWGALMAAATLIALPPLVLAALVQRWLVSGLTLGAVKGLGASMNVVSISQFDHASRRVPRPRTHHHRARGDAGSGRRRGAGARLAHGAVRLGLQALAQGRGVHRGPRDLRRGRAAGPSPCMAAAAPSISRCIATVAPPAGAATPRCAWKCRA